jgi:hypothetical protein
VIVCDGEDSNHRLAHDVSNVVREDAQVYASIAAAAGLFAIHGGGAVERRDVM